MNKSLTVSIKVYLGLMAYLVLVKLILTFLPAVFRSAAQAAVFQWKWITIFTATGLLGVFLADRTGFPAAWGGGISNRARILLPAALGAGLGVLAIGTEVATGWTKFVAAKMNLPTIHIDFPASALIYPGGAIIVEVAYRIFLMPFFLWLVSSMILRGRAQEQTFWALAVITSAIEPVTQDLSGMLAGQATFAFALVFIEDYALNFSQAWLFRRYGFLSAVLLRVFFYLVWHVLWGLTGR